MTRIGSSAASGPWDETSTGSPKSIDHLVGNGTTPSGPSHGNVGVSGKYGSPSGLPTQSAFAHTGWISSAPTTAHGTIGVPVRSAMRTNPPRPKRARR